MFSFTKRYRFPQIPHSPPPIPSFHGTELSEFSISPSVSTRFLVHSWIPFCSSPNQHKDFQTTFLHTHECDFITACIYIKLIWSMISVLWWSYHIFWIQNKSLSLMYLSDFRLNQSWLKLYLSRITMVIFHVITTEAFCSWLFHFEIGVQVLLRTLHALFFHNGTTFVSRIYQCVWMLTAGQSIFSQGLLW